MRAAPLPVARRIASRRLPRRAASAAAVALAAVAGPVAPASAASVAKNERGILQCVNAERAKRGIAALKQDPSLAKAARFHAKQMRTKRFFDHTDPAGRSPADRVRRYTNRFGAGVGENIAAGGRTPKATCRQWMNSAGHRANILDPDYRYLGTGYAKGGKYRHYWVQVFGLKPRS